MQLYSIPKYRIILVLAVFLSLMSCTDDTSNTSGPSEPTIEKAELQAIYKSSAVGAEGLNNSCLFRSYNKNYLAVIDMNTAVVMNENSDIVFQSQPLGDAIRTIGVGSRHVVLYIYNYNEDDTILWLDRDTSKVIHRIPVETDARGKRIYVRGHAMVGPDLMWLALHNGHVYLIDIDNPANLRESVVPSEILSAPVEWRNSVLLISDEGIYTIDSKNMKPTMIVDREDSRYPWGVGSSPAIWSDELAIVGMDEVAFINLTTRSVQSRIAIESRGDSYNPPIFKDGRLILKTGGHYASGRSRLLFGELMCIRSETGEVIWKQDTYSVMDENNMALDGHDRIMIPESVVDSTGSEVTAIVYHDFESGEKVLSRVVADTSWSLQAVNFNCPPFYFGDELCVCNRNGSVYRVVHTGN